MKQSLYMEAAMEQQKYMQKQWQNKYRQKVSFVDLACLDNIVKKLEG